jgi:hypothetical protein
MELADPLCQTQGKRYDLVEARCVGGAPVKEKIVPGKAEGKRLIETDRTIYRRGSDGALYPTSDRNPYDGKWENVY